LSIDYLSPTVYLTDLLVIGILISWWWQKRKISKKHAIRNAFKKHWWLGAVFIFLFTNSLLAANNWAAIYKLVKLAEFAFLGFYISKENYSLFNVRYYLSWAVIYSSLIAVFQFIKQASLGGLFWWLGERSFNLITPGIARAVANGQLVLRPYATFSHPNVLAGFVFISMILIGSRKNQGLVKWPALALGSLAVILSFSRSVWLVGLLLGLWLAVNRWRREKGKILIGLGLSLIFIGNFFHLVRDFSGQEAISQRLALAGVALEMIKANLFTGVGFNNFIFQLPSYWQQFGMTYWLQPVHNVFLLIAAEIGLTGLMIFLWCLFLTFKRLLTARRWSLAVALMMILMLGFFDHYWLTLQQTQLLLAIVFGLSWGEPVLQ
jgi:hypothetical protein